MISQDEKDQLEEAIEQFAHGLISKEEDKWIQAKLAVLTSVNEARKNCPKDLNITATKNWMDNETRQARYDFAIADHEYNLYLRRIDAAKFILRTK
jgi:hypothetical protein